MSLLDAILNASQLSKFYFASSPGMTGGDHGSLASLLGEQCNAKLRDLTLRDLQALDQTLEMHAQMPQQFPWLYPKYLALRARVDDNWRKWNGAVPLVEEGMKLLLSRLGGVDPMVVPLDIARRAARFAIDGNGAETESLSVLNKSARPKVSASETSFPIDKI
jgi:hypothetical protein